MENIDQRAERYLRILRPEWNIPRIEQTIGRAIRLSPSRPVDFTIQSINIPPIPLRQYTMPKNYHDFYTPCDIPINDDNICSICLENYKNEDCCVMPNNCKHIFHENCLKIWIDQNEVCPLCKQNMEKQDLSKN
jgi:hypothetical protein